MARHRNGVMSGVKKVQFDCAQQAELVCMLRLELLSCLEPVHKLCHLLGAVIPGTDAVYHLHLHATHNASFYLIMCKGVVSCATK